MMRYQIYELFDAAAYIRLSSEDGDKEESNSVVNQRSMLKEYVRKQEGIVIRDFYIDDGYTGTNFNRPAFQRMMADIEAGKINCVIVKDLSRFGRDYIDCGRYLERIFPEMNIRFIAITDAIDSLKQAYDMLLPIKNIFNEQYARDISQKVQTAVVTKQRAGQFIGAFTCYGYMKSPMDKNRLIVDEYAAEVVRRIFQMFVQGCGKQEIAKILNQEGILCPSEYKKANGLRYSNGRRLATTTYWSYTTITKILQSEIYIGNMVQGTKHQKLRGKQKAVSKENWIVVKGTHEPIIEQDVWRKTQSLLAHRTRIMDCSKPSVNIFAGFLKCGDCGRAMAKEVWRLKDGTPRYQLNCGTSRRNGKAFCSPHSIPLRVLERIVLDDLRAVIGSVKNIREIAERQWEGARKQILFADRQLERLHTDLNKAQGLKQSLYEDYKDGLITREEYTMFRGKYIEKESLLTEQIRDWEERRRQESKNDLFENPWLKRLIELKDIEKLDRGIVAEMIHEIRVYENLKILVQYNFSEELEHLFADAFIDEP